MPLDPEPTPPLRFAQQTPLGAGADDPERAGPPRRAALVPLSALFVPPYQEQVWRSVVAGEDVQLIMPTGAGKSLCYQLPGLAREGTARRSPGRRSRWSTTA